MPHWPPAFPSDSLKFHTSLLKTHAKSHSAILQSQVWMVWLNHRSVTTEAVWACRHLSHFCKKEMAGGDSEVKWYAVLSHRDWRPCNAWLVKRIIPIENIKAARRVWTSTEMVMDKISHVQRKKLKKKKKTTYIITIALIFRKCKH